MSSDIPSDDKHSYSFMSRLQDVSHPDGDFVGGVDDGGNNSKMDDADAAVSLDRTRTTSRSPFLTPVVYLRDVFVQTLALLRKNVILYVRDGIVARLLQLDFFFHSFTHYSYLFTSHTHTHTHHITTTSHRIASKSTSSGVDGPRLLHS